MQAWECAPGRAASPLASGYLRREPEKTVLHEVVSEHLESWLEELSQEGMTLPRYVEQDLRRYLPRGLISEG